MNKVVPFASLSPVENVVSLAEELLADAKSGKVRAVVVVTARRGRGSRYDYCVGDQTAFALISPLTVCLHELSAAAANAAETPDPEETA